MPYVKHDSNRRHGWSQLLSGGDAGEQVSLQVSPEVSTDGAVQTVSGELFQIQGAVELKAATAVDGLTIQGVLYSSMHARIQDCWMIGVDVSVCSH